MEVQRGNQRLDIIIVVVIIIICIFIIDEPELQLEKAVHADSVRGVAFSPSGSRLFSIGTDLQLLISDVETGQPIMSLQEAFEYELI